METLAAEEWRTIEGFEGFYEVSSRGRVRSLDRVVDGKNGTTRRRRSAILSQDTSGNGYPRVVLQRERVRTKRLVSGLVLEAFVGPRPDGMEACHFPDPNPQNNTVENLRWDTKSANMQDRIAHGNNPQSNKTHCPQNHEYTPANTHITKGTTHRHCRECDRIRTNEANRKKRLATQRERIEQEGGSHERLWTH